MSSIGHMLQGTRVVIRNWPLVVIAFVAKVGLSLLFMIPLQRLIGQNFSHRPAIAALLTEWDMTVMMDGVFSQLGSLRPYGYFVPAAVITVVVVHLFLSGGMVHGLAASFGEESEPFGLERFFAWCARHFIIFFKLALIAVLFYAAAAVLWIVLSEFGSGLIKGQQGSELARLVAAVARILGLVVLFLIVNMAMTYGRIAAVLDHEPNLRGIFTMVGKFWARQFVPAALLYLGLAAGLLFIIGLYWMVWAGCGLLPTAMKVATLFLVQQVVSLLRSWYRLVGYASQAGLYVGHSSER